MKEERLIVFNINGGESQSDSSHSGNDIKQFIADYYNYGTCNYVHINY